MNIDYLIQLLTNRLNGLALAKDQAFQSGDLERIVAVDAEILDVQNTISKLKLVASIEQTAANTQFSEAEVVKNGIEASFNPTVINDSTEVLLAYDITSYATDPMHELKIQNILEKMGLMDTAEQIETYIKKTSPDSPLTGTMVYAAAQEFVVDARLMLALMELDSRFGTVGVAVRTLNPGNVGNDGTNTKTYESWQGGVNAVAIWLDRHRIVKKVPVEIPAMPEESPIEEIPVVSEPEETPVEMVIPTTVENIVNTPVETPVETPTVESETIPDTTVIPIETPTTPPDTTVSMRGKKPKFL